MRRKHVRPSLVQGAVILAVVGIPAAAAAQTSGSPTGFALDSYEPTPAGDPFFMAEHPWYSSTRVFAMGITGDYAANPLVLDQTLSTGEVRTTNVVSGMLVGHVGAAVSFLDRFNLHASLPVSLSQSGDAVVGAAAITPASGIAVGDLRAGPRIRIAGHSDEDPISLHLGGSVWIPIGKRADNMGDEAVRIEPRLTLAGRASLLRWSFSGGFMIRSSLNDVANLAVGNQLRLNAGLALVFLEDRLWFGPEGYVVTAVRDLPNGIGTGNAAFQSNQWGAEVLGSVHFMIADAVMIGAGAGPGICRTASPPSGRSPPSETPPSPPPRCPGGARHRPRRGDGPDDLCPTVPMGAHPDPQRRGCPAGDRDGDGVTDDVDQCPDTPAGPHPDPARLGCPVGDRDHDGVLDPDDQCPDTPQGDHPDPHRPGCPVGDRDHDGVNDDVDQCPDTPQGDHPDPARPGCPAPPPTAVVTESRITINEHIYFDTDRAVIQARSFPILDEVVRALSEHTDIRKVRVEGNADDTGEAHHNLTLSRRRAAAVVDYLVHHGVDRHRLSSVGYGSSRPAAQGESEEARQQNRRVEFIIVQGPGAGSGNMPGDTGGHHHGGGHGHGHGH